MVNHDPKVPVTAEALSRVRSLDRSKLDESDMTATQCEGCGYWTTVYYRAYAWTADGDREDADYCALCEPRALHPDYGNWPSGWTL